MSSKLHKVRRFPAQKERVETGPIMFGDDWPGVFIRGDNAHYYAMALQTVLVSGTEIGVLARIVIPQIVKLLQASDCRNNDAFSGWHKDGSDEEKPRV